MKTPIKENITFNNIGVIKELIPINSSVNSFLFYSGGIEFKLAVSDRQVIAHTNKYIIYEFWKCVMENAPAVAEWSKNLSKLLEPHPVFSNQKTFSILQESWTSYDNPYTRAGFFFLLNRCSEMGLISSGKMRREDFNSLALINLQRFKIKNFDIMLDKKEDYLNSIEDTKDGEYLLFPVGSYGLNLFEQGKNKGFESTTIHHKNLYEKLKNEDRKWIILYKYSDYVLENYKEFNIIKTDKYGRKTTREDRCEDIVVFNF